MMWTSVTWLFLCLSCRSAIFWDVDSWPLGLWERMLLKVASISRYVRSGKTGRWSICGMCDYSCSVQWMSVEFLECRTGPSICILEIRVLLFLYSNCFYIIPSAFVMSKGKSLSGRTDDSLCFCSKQKLWIIHFLTFLWIFLGMADSSRSLLT